MHYKKKNNSGGNKMKSITIKRNVTINNEKARAAQRVLMDNGIDPGETGIVLQALGAVILEEDLEKVIDWNPEHLPYKESVWEKPEIK